jgi:hypothetical protein
MPARPTPAANAGPGAAGPKGPPAAVKTVVTTLVLLHFFAIVTTVTSAQSRNFPASELAIRLNLWFRPYLQLVFLTNPYRFYAPDPGATNVFWLRIEYADGSVRWWEMPRRADFGVRRIAYQRTLSLTMLFDSMMTPVPTPINPNGRMLSPEGRIVLSSYMRHVARVKGQVKADGTPNPVKRIRVYNVYHVWVEPPQVKMGMTPEDIRTYRPSMYGYYEADGTRIAENHGLLGAPPPEMDAMQDMTTMAVVAQMLQKDIYPAIKRNPQADRFQLLVDLGIPEPVRRMLGRFPEILDPSFDGDELQSRLESAVSRDDKYDF